MTSPHVRQNAAASAHLVAYGLIGTGVITVFATLLGVGIGLIPVFGVGLLILPLAALLLFGVGWFEDARVAGLFGYPTPRRRIRRSDRTDGWRYLHTLWLQLIDARSWLGVLHLVIMTALGGAALWLVRTVASSLMAFFSSLFAPLDQVTTPFLSLRMDGWISAIVNLGFIALALWGLYALGMAHAGISRMLIPSRTSELEAVAATATARRDNAMQAATVERTRIERDLHDGVQPRLVSIGMTLGMAKTKIHDDPASAAALIDEAHASTKEAITELRQLARGIRPAVLEDRGLDAALSALAARSPIPVTLDVRLAERASETAESAMYFAVAESLTNAAKHSGAASCRVTILSRPGNMMWGRIEDDGIGGARLLPGGGLDGIQNRVQAAGGSLIVASPAGGPTTIEVSVPCGL